VSTSILLGLFLACGFIFLASTATLIRIMGDLLKDYQDTKYTWWLVIAFILITPTLVILTRLITLSQMCGE
jgi:hypothetical protein